MLNSNSLAFLDSKNQDRRTDMAHLTQQMMGNKNQKNRRRKIGYLTQSETSVLTCYIHEVY